MFGSKAREQVGMVTETTGFSRSVRVKFQLEEECQFGDRFHIVGDDPVLGSWNPTEAIPFNWSEGHIWSLLLIRVPSKRNRICLSTIVINTFDCYISPSRVS